MKKALALILVLLLPVALYAGGKQEPAKAGQPVKTIDILWHTNPAGQQTMKLHQEFEAKYGCKVNYYEISVAVVQQKIMVEWAAKTKAYDVVNSATHDQMIGSGAAKDLTPLIAKANPTDLKMDDFLPPMKELMTRGGKWYAFPVRNDTRIMYLNRRMFREAGMDADGKPPVTFAETLAAAQKLNNPGKDQAGWIIGYKGTYAYSWVIPYWIATFGGQLFDAKWKPTFNSPDGVRAMQLYVDLLRKYKVVNADALAMDHPEQTTALLNARGAININVPGRWADQFKPEFPKVKDDLTVAAPPKEKTWVPPSAGWGLYVMNDTDAEDLAFAYCAWATSADVQKRIIKAGGDCNPTRLSVISDLDMQKSYPIFKAIYNIGAAASPGPQYPESSQVGEIMSKYLRQAANGEISVEEAMASSATKVEQLLAALGRYDTK